MLLAGARNLLAFAAVALVLVAAAVVWRRPRPLPGPAAGCRRRYFALLQGTAFALIFWAERYITSGQTAVLIATNPLFTLPLTRFWLKERVSARQYLAVLLGLIGVGLTAGVREGEGFTGTLSERVTAQGAVLVAAFCYAFSLLYSRKYMQATGPRTPPSTSARRRSTYCCCPP